MKVKAKRRKKRNPSRRKTSRKSSTRKIYVMGAKPMKRRRRRSIKRNPVIRRRRRKRNPSGGIGDMLIYSALVAGSTVGGALLSKLLAGTIGGLMKKTDDASMKLYKNVSGLALVAISAFLAPKFLGQDKAKALTGGLLTALALNLAKNSFGFDAFSGVSLPGNSMITDKTFFEGDDISGVFEGFYDQPVTDIEDMI